MKFSQLTESLLKIHFSTLPKAMEMSERIWPRANVGYRNTSTYSHMDNKSFLPVLDPIQIILAASEHGILIFLQIRSFKDIIFDTLCSIVITNFGKGHR